MLLEGLQAVDVVGMVMADHDNFDGLVGQLADALQHPVAQRRRAEGVEHHHPCIGDHEAGIRGMALVHRVGNARQSLDVIHGDARHLEQLEGQADRSIRRLHRRRGHRRHAGQQRESQHQAA